MDGASSVALLLKEISGITSTRVSQEYLLKRHDSGG